MHTPFEAAILAHCQLSVEDKPWKGLILLRAAGFNEQAVSGGAMWYPGWDRGSATLRSLPNGGLRGAGRSPLTLTC